MTNKTLDQLTGVTPPLVATDLFAVLRNASGILTSVAWSTIQSTLQSAFSAVYLQIGNNLSDVASVATARSNLGVAAMANNLSDLPSTAQAAVNLGLGLAFRNRLINGDMRIDQRRAGASVTPPNGTTYTVDRWALLATQASKIQIGQNLNAVTPPTGFSNYLGVQVAAAFTPGIADLFVISQTVEGLNIQDLLWGTANAKAVTLSFWVRSSLTGTFGGSIESQASSTSYVFTYAINVANTWEQKTISIAGPTTGTWPITTAAGLQLQISLGVGSNYYGTAGVWSAAALITVSGETKIITTLGATFYLTGVQFEPGSVASAFERRPYATELRFCQRYFESNFQPTVAPANGVANGIYIAQAASATTLQASVDFKVSKRAAPTMAFYLGARLAGTAGQWNYLPAGAGWSAGSGTAVQGVDTVQFGLSITGVITSGNAVSVNGGWTADAEL